MITVFISYSHDSEHHIQQVVDLGTKLIEWGGIDVVLDQWESSPEEGWTLWMEKQIKNTDFTLIICSSAYYDKVIHDTKAGVGKGVKWEGRMIRNLLYTSDSKGNKFIPVLLDNGKPVHILTALKDSTHYYAHTEEGFEKLYRFLTAQPDRKKPKPKPTSRKMPLKDRPATTSDPSFSSTNFPDIPTELNELPTEPLPNDPASLVERGELRKALEVLKMSVPDYRKTEVLQLLAQVNSLEKDRRLGMLTDEQANTRRNRITYNILNLIEGEE